MLLDFFGTLVGYSPSRTEQGYHASHALAGSMGVTIDYQAFLRAWAAESARFDQRSAADDSEFSMEELAAAFLARILGREPDLAERTAFVDSYIAEWNSAVSYPPGIGETVGMLADHFRLAVVTNTHQADLVPRHLAAMGIAQHFDAVVTSGEAGKRKPHPAIYAETLRRLDTNAQAAIFAGDTYDADYAGPDTAGMTAFLIDRAGHYPVPASRRLRSLHDLPERRQIQHRSPANSWPRSSSAVPPLPPASDHAAYGTDQHSSRCNDDRCSGGECRGGVLLLSPRPARLDAVANGTGGEALVVHGPVRGEDDRPRPDVHRRRDGYQQRAHP